MMKTPPGELTLDSSTEKFLPLCLLALQMDRVTASLQYTNPCNTPLFHSPTVGIKFHLRHLIYICQNEPQLHFLYRFREWQYLMCQSLCKITCGFLNTVVSWCATVL